MSRLSATKRIGTLVTAGALTLGLATAGIASAQTPLAAAAGGNARTAVARVSKPCTPVKKIERAARIKITASEKTRKNGAIACIYKNAKAREVVATQPTRYKHMSSKVFWARMAATAKHFGTKLHRVSGSKAYCYENIKIGGKPVIFGASNDRRHMITIESNLSKKKEIALIRAI